MIVLDNVIKRFGNKLALSGVSLRVKPGEIAGFLGPNGAGKTTTMRLLLGHLKPNEGKVTVDGCDPIEDRLEVVSRIGYLPENNPLYLDMKVKEYLSFVYTIKQASDNLKEVLEQVGLTEMESVKIENLSRGYRQRVGLAAALLGNPKILILDEPTSGLDPLEQEKIKELVKNVGKDKIVIFSTHILPEVEDVANRLVIVHKGKIVYDGDKPNGKGKIDELFKKYVSN